MANTTDALEPAVLERLAALGGHCQSAEELFSKFNCKASQQSQICHRLQEIGPGDLARGYCALWAIGYGAKLCLKLDTSVWPVTPDQLLVLRSCARGRISPQQIHARVPANQRQGLLRQLAHQGLIVVYQTAIVEIELIRQPGSASVAGDG